MVQPEGSSQEKSPVGRTVPLRRIGCAGRVTAYQELDDGRLHLTLTGIARFALRDEVALEKPYRVASVAPTTSSSAILSWTPARRTSTAKAS